MIEINQDLEQIISEMALLLENNDMPDPLLYAKFLEEPELAFQLIDFVNNLEDEQAPQDLPLYSATIFALDLCVAQLQAASEHHHKASAKILEQLMHHLAEAINSKIHSVSFWLPALNAFYETHVELSTELKDAYFNLANDDENESDSYDDASHLDAIRELIRELADLSDFDIAENFFAQSYAMPPEFFADLVMDLYSIEEGQDIALLCLLHPKHEVRKVVIYTIDQFIDRITLSPLSLSRLQSIQHWYPEEYQAQINRWIKIQRKKGVIFAREGTPKKLVLHASEVDGSGSQGLFIHEKEPRRNRLSGLLFKVDSGIKDAWVTPVIPAADVKRYYTEAFDDSVTLRPINLNYLKLMCEHFLYITQSKGHIPHLHFLEVQEMLCIQFKPQKINMDEMIKQLGIQISPFTSETLNEALKRSKTWPKNKRFTESWFEENPKIDKLVNRYCSFVDSVKVCDFNEAMNAVFKEDMETHRDKWLFHFLWIALWLQPHTRKNEKSWQDSFFIAYAIHEGYALNTIPIMQEICYQTVVNSVETMLERRTHLNQE